MKNKKIIYLLLPLVVIIWGIILYRVFSISADPGLPTADHPSINKDAATPLLDTFSINANYRDPFLDKVMRVQHDDKIKNPTAKKVEKVITPSKWPDLTYFGIIKNQESGKKLIMINIDGKSNFIKEGHEASGIHLLKVYKDSIEVSFMKEKRIVRK